MAAAAARHLLRSPPTATFLLSHSPRPMTTMSRPPPDHDFSKACEYLGSWDPPRDPKEAEAKLAMLRRDYAKRVKELRRDYINEMELLRQEKQRKDEAKKEAIRLAKEERKAAKAAASAAKAAERKIAEDEFRQTILKERAEKLEYWRMREKQVEEKKKAEREDLTAKSSLWIGEDELEKRLMEAMVDSSTL